jgi:hypothetical protein
MTRPPSPELPKKQRRRPAETYVRKFNPETHDAWEYRCQDKNGIAIYGSVAVPKGKVPMTGTTVPCRHCGRPALVTRRLRRPA